MYQSEDFLILKYNYKKVKLKKITKYFRFTGISFIVSRIRAFTVYLGYSKSLKNTK